MDGTLINSESLTDRGIGELLRQYAIRPGDLDYVQFHGIAWRQIENRLKHLFPALDEVDIAAFLQRRFDELSVVDPPPLLNGARAAFLEAGRHLPTAITTGSDSKAVERLLDSAGLRPACTLYVSCEMHAHSKPHPEPYLLTAEKLGVPADRCLVFEDSAVGLQAAKSAGMKLIAVTQTHPDHLPPDDCADGVIADYTDLPADFFSRIK